MDNIVYISDNYLSAGHTYIYNRDNQVVGSLDLKSIFSSSVSVFDIHGNPQASGKFKGLSRKWTIFNGQMEALGRVKSVFFSFSKKYTYHTFNRGKLSIESPAFSRNYIIYDDRNNEVATFKRINNFMSSPAYEVQNKTDFFTIAELIVVVMGVNAIQKRRRHSNKNMPDQHYY